MTNEKEIATTMNNYYNVTKLFNLKFPKKFSAKDLSSIVSEHDFHVSIKRSEIFPDTNFNDINFETNCQYG